MPAVFDISAGQGVRIFRGLTSANLVAAGGDGNTDPYGEYVSLLMHFDPESVFPPNAIAFWKLSDLTDSSGNSNTLTNSGSAQFVSGKVGDCVQFNTSNYLRNTALSTPLNPDGPDGEFTASIWINPSSFSNYQAFLGAPSGGGFIIHTDASGAIYCNETTAGDAFVSSTLQLNQWQHVVFVKSNSSGYRTKVWYNGTQVYDQLTNNRSNYDASVTDITLGNYGGLGFPYNGKLDAVGLWNRELTDQEIATLYNNGSGLEP